MAQYFPFIIVTCPIESSIFMKHTDLLKEVLDILAEDDYLKLPCSLCFSCNIWDKLLFVLSEIRNQRLTKKAHLDKHSTCQRSETPWHCQLVIIMMSTVCFSIFP